ncbi:UNVERIFIED_CONTAM: hypothetical protein GTU68_029898 [Idotea baltica]|nr:hypothetical protein [Idotea baltica]
MAFVHSRNGRNCVRRGCYGWRTLGRGQDRIATYAAHTRALRSPHLDSGE